MSAIHRSKPLAGAPRFGVRRSGRSIRGAPPRLWPLAAALLLLLLPCSRAAQNTRGILVFETTTPHHYIRVVDSEGLRTLHFDDTTQSRMGLRDPLTGHFEYTELFHTPLLWNARMTNVLMIGLGGASAQRSFEHYYTNMFIETVEIDPAVLRVAKDYFRLQESPRQKVHVEDGRVFLRRNPKRYDLIIMDAYTENRYGGFIPQHLATKEFFELAEAHLTTNGVLAYNVMGTYQGWRADLVGAMYKTMKTVFPQVYLFQAVGSWNVVIVATQSPQRVDLSTIKQRAAFLVNQKLVTLPTFVSRASAFRAQPPPSASRAPVLTDEFAPVEGLLDAAMRDGRP